MSSLPWIPWRCSKWLSSKTRLLMNTSERSIYFDLLNCVYEYGGALPNDPEKLAVLAGVSPEELKKAWPIVGENFVARDDGTLTNLVALEVMETQTRLHAAKSTAGKKGAEVRWQGHLSANGNREEKTREEKTREDPLLSDGKKRKAPSVKKALTDGQQRDFDEVWNLYHQKGRRFRPAAEQAFLRVIELPADPVAVHAAIVTSLKGKWATSRLWTEGFVVNLEKWILNRCWDEDPEQVAAPVADTREW